MDRSEAFLIYIFFVTALIELALVIGGEESLGVYLGLYSLSYLPAAWYAKPRGYRHLMTIAAAVTSAFILYSALKVVGLVP
ncbi:hypothetical protein ASAC_1349 [Acidilobus saccharovorans 345-15]|uniref:Uncharacterized protein n=1 Tax=Acidilobus saccharovorans (strain DSM 16705 / JCM 18335 / VKM B-2471 / 345-15) TaxID=666510 RepID=D9Q366_ACIS3|nr:hypothetical protein [Acidilobus saccharovorans]ADL19754.1 hypothetical protein ASAC_1349 [Acidilobus saccharovorans 345-15]